MEIIRHHQLNKKQTIKDTAKFTKFSINQILSSDTYYKPRKTKIIATIGPSCGNSVEMLSSMIDHGMDIARISCEQTPDIKEIETYIANIKLANQKYPHKHCSILIEIAGPILHIGKLEKAESIQLQKGQTLEIINDVNFVGNSQKIGCSFKDLSKVLHVDEFLALQEGNIVCKVKEIKENSVIVEVKSSGQLDELKKIYFPEMQIQIADEYLSGPKQEYFNLPTITEKDILYLKEIVLKHNIDFVSISRVIGQEDIQQVRQILIEGGGPSAANINLLAKIGTKRGFQNFESILKEADGIQVMRGMLGGEILSEKIPVCQKYMINKANEAGKPIIVASQIFESMIKNPRPTRAEASDAANAILDGADALMFTSETFKGDYVIEAIDYLRNICHEAELCVNYHQRFLTVGRQKKNSLMAILKGEIDNSCVMAVNLSFDLNVEAILCLTCSGKTARFLQKYKPQAQIVAVSPSEKVQRQLQLISNVCPVKVPEFQNSEDAIQAGINKAKELKIIKKGHKIIVIDSLTQFHPDCEREVKVIIIQ